eukprot:638241_1
MCRYQYFVSPAPTSFRALTSRTEARSPSQSPAYNRTELSHLSANPSVSPVAADTTHYNDYNEVLSQIGDHDDRQMDNIWIVITVVVMSLFTIGTAFTIYNWAKKPTVNSKTITKSGKVYG